MRIPFQVPRPVAPLLRAPARAPGGRSAAHHAASAFVVAALVALPAVAHAQQVRTLTACTPDALAVCAELRLTAGPTSVELALRTVGSAQAALPLTLYNLVLGTGTYAAAAVDPRTTLVGPAPIGGATLADASPWELFDSGDALFLSALTNHGVGGCDAGGDVGGFGQAATTCGAGQFVTFSFAPTTAFDVSQFAILDLEAVGLTAGLPAASCGALGKACVLTADVTTPPAATTAPEPATVALVGAGLLLAGITTTPARRRGT